jgi:hypothetical protein
MGRFQTWLSTSLYHVLHVVSSILKLARSTPHATVSMRSYAYKGFNLCKEVGRADLSPSNFLCSLNMHMILSIAGLFILIESVSANGEYFCVPQDIAVNPATSEQTNCAKWHLKAAEFANLASTANHALADVHTAEARRHGEEANKHHPTHSTHIDSVSAQRLHRQAKDIYRQKGVKFAAKENHHRDMNNQLTNPKTKLSRAFICESKAAAKESGKTSFASIKDAVKKLCKASPSRGALTAVSENLRRQEQRQFKKKTCPNLTA